MGTLTEDDAMDDLTQLEETIEQLLMRRDEVLSRLAFEALDEAVEAVRRAEITLRTCAVEDLVRA